jgi:hypothetical protein
MLKYLILEFSGARVFREFNSKNINDYYLDYGYPQDRINQRYFVEPITKYQVANLLSVMMGERPYPSLRKVFHKRYEPALEIAENSYIKINDFTYLNEKTGEEKYIYESMQLKKSAINSWSTRNYYTWEKFKIYLDHFGLFDFFKTELSNYFKVKDCTKIPIKTIRKVLAENLSLHYNVDDIRKCKDEKEFNNLINSKPLPEDLQNLYSVLINSKKAGFFKSLILNKNDFNKFKGIERLTQMDFTSKVICLSGEIIIPLDENQVEKIRECYRCTTFLDGGSVRIKKLTSGSMINTDGFRKLSEISTETKTYI